LEEVNVNRSIDDLVENIKEDEDKEQRFIADPYSYVNFVEFHVITTRTDSS